MPRLVREVHVAAPPSKVFALVTDFGQVAKVLPGILESVVLTPGPIAVGSRIREKRDVKGRVRESEMVVTAHEPDRRFWMDVHSGGKKAGEGGFDLAPAEGGTRLRYTLDFRLPGLMVILTPLVKPIVVKEMEGDVAAIKRAAESR
jgi:carbon monoxide dehydrogenase subunit G